MYANIHNDPFSKSKRNTRQNLCIFENSSLFKIQLNFSGINHIFSLHKITYKFYDKICKSINISNLPIPIYFSIKLLVQNIFFYWQGVFFLFLFFHSFSLNFPWILKSGVYRKGCIIVLNQWNSSFVAEDLFELLYFIELLISPDSFLVFSFIIHIRKCDIWIFRIFIPDFYIWTVCRIVAPDVNLCI